MLSSKRLATLSSSLTVSIGNVPLEEVQTYKYLGVMINNNLSSHEHIDYIKSKFNKTLGLLRCIKNYLPIHNRLLFFNSYIFYLSSIMLISFGGIQVIQPLCQIYKYYIIKQHGLFQTQIKGHLPVLCTIVVCTTQQFISQQDPTEKHFYSS